MTARRLRRFVVGSAAVALVVILALPPGAWARWRAAGAGGCGTLAEALAGAVDGDVLTPMRGGINNSGAALTNSLVVQGGWAPATGDCNSNGTGGDPKVSYETAADLLAAGFTYDPAQRSELFGDFNGPTLPISLTGGLTAALQNLAFGFYSINGSGAAISGVISDGARLRLENLRFEGNQVGVNGVGGAVLIQVRGGSQLVIADSEFSTNQAFSGGALRVELYGNSSLVIERSSFSNNEAIGGDGGAVEVVVESGSVTIRDSTFSDNVATNGAGGAVRVERAPGATGSAVAHIAGNTYSGNSASGSADLSLEGVTTLTPRLFLPLTKGSLPPSAYRVTISNISLDGESYSAAFTTAGYTPQLPGRHIHFFFDTVPPAQAGMPGAGPWKIYGGGSPFTGYGIVDRPAGATRLCALVANADHSVIPGTGNCVALP